MLHTSAKTERPSATVALRKMENETIIKKCKNFFRSEDPERKDILSKLVGIAIKSAKSGKQLDIASFEKEAQSIGIDISSENGAVQLVDLKAVISLANSYLNLAVKDEDVLAVGGREMVVDEMTTRAKVLARIAKRPINEAGDFLEQPEYVILKMPKVMEKSKQNGVYNEFVQKG